MVLKSNVVYDITNNNVYDIAYDNVSNVISDIVSKVGIFKRAPLGIFADRFFLDLRSSTVHTFTFSVFDPRRLPGGALYTYSYITDSNVTVSKSVIRL